MSESVVASGASSALTGTKNVLMKAAPWIALLAGVFIGGYLDGLLFNVIFRTAGVETMLVNYVKDHGTLMRIQWAITAGIVAVIGIVLYRQDGVVFKVVGMFFLGAAIRGAINALLGVDGPYNAPAPGA